MAIGAQSVIWAALYFAMPDYPAKNPDLSYLGAFATMGKFLVTNPVLGEHRADYDKITNRAER